ncbi:fungal-specific transcription factor domain-containing protein [Aspergillus pseudonomiae]|uniref:Fungal-specific transcription factor domain-containing protein n=1 Tax=Aspergillus pseudonomiae TaxID=1506151 RepID=A0A5N7D6T2_9EURO|nr:fungal-specific transcription factor domain-containing protein [Aspergillus pseudonomiae]KAE8402140.1 fungal-specific transcription factor domain-containing protein [Aspergillus pseudonomiae]
MATTTAPHFQRKRRRPALACEQCRRRKIRCDRNHPCASCRRSDPRSCHYVDPDRKTNVAHDQVIDLAPTSFSSGNPPLDLPNCPEDVQFSGLLNVDALQSTSSSLANPTTVQRSKVSHVPEDLQEGSLVQSLTDRVRQLEKKLEEALDLQPPDSYPNQSPIRVREHSSINGRFLKTRFFGNSHRSICEYRVHDMLHMFYRKASETPEIQTLYERCKQLARTAKSQEIIHQKICPDLRDYMPPKETSDRLIQAYLRTFESVYRIVHVPSFLREYDQYWRSPQAASPAFIIMTLLMLAIGNSFCQSGDPDKDHVPRSTSSQWIYTAQTWLSSPFEKSRLNITSLQTHCLLLLARQTSDISSDLVWISAGTLLRTAMHMGFHIDPRHIKGISFFDAQLRRRIWNTILEIVVQSSMDAGGIPLIHCDDYDCEPPLNLDDAQMEDPIPMAKPFEDFTDTSLQIALQRSLPIRLQIAQFLNDFRRGASYDEALQLNKGLTNIYRENSALFDAFKSSGKSPTLFQSNLYDLMTQRFLLALHDPFAIKAKADPTLYYSHKVALEISMRILAPFSKSVPEDLDYTALLLTGSPSFRDVPTQAAAVVADDMIVRIKEKPITTSVSALYTSYPLSHRESKRIIEEFTSCMLARVESGETNIKGYLVSACFLAQIEAMEHSRPIDEALSRTMLSVLETCSKILEDRVEKSSLSQPGIGLNTATNEESTLAVFDNQLNWSLGDDFVSYLHVPRRKCASEVC